MEIPSKLTRPEKIKMKKIARCRPAAAGKNEEGGCTDGGPRGARARTVSHDAPMRESKGRGRGMVASGG